MTDKSMTSRRSFLKSGTIVAAPLAVMGAPAAAALADDGSRLRLARIEDERAIEALNRSFLRSFNAGGAKKAGEHFVGGKASGLAKGMTGLSLDGTAEAEHFAVSDDGDRASAHYAVTAEFEHAFEGEGTLLQMARLQGNAEHRHAETRKLVAHYVKREQGWAIERLSLA